MSDPYRSPIKGMELTETLVPEISNIWCRVFGHKYRGSYTVGGNGFTNVYPNDQYPPHRFHDVWCINCGREWKRAPKL